MTFIEMSITARSTGTVTITSTPNVVVVERYSDQVVQTGTAEYDHGSGTSRNIWYNLDTTLLVGMYRIVFTVHGTDSNGNSATWIPFTDIDVQQAP